ETLLALAQNHDARLAFAQVALNFFRREPERRFVPFDAHAMHAASAIERSPVNPESGNLAEFAYEEFRLLRRMQIAGFEVQRGVFLGCQPHADHLLAPDLHAAAQRIRMRARVQPRRLDERLAAGEYPGTLRSTHVLSTGDAEEVDS